MPKPELEYDSEDHSAYIQFLPVKEKIDYSVPFGYKKIILILDFNNKDKLIGVAILNP